MTIENKTHWLRNDFRIESLRQILIGLDNSIHFLKEKIKDNNFYDGLWFLEEAEPIYGLAFIAFQNYINGTITDFSEITCNKTKYYNVGQDLNDFGKSKIELIIGLANYSKHKDEKKLHKGTKEILEHFKLNLLNDNEKTNHQFLKGCQY